MKKYLIICLIGMLVFVVMGCSGDMAYLEDENMRLQAEVDDLQYQLEESIPHEEYTELENKYNDLQIDYDNLYYEYSTLEDQSVPLDTYWEFQAVVEQTVLDLQDAGYDSIADYIWDQVWIYY
jgi:predicted nuclease with TOPRIM domain